MSLGGINTNYDSTSPPDNENAGLGATRIRSLETTIQQVLDSEHNFPASGGANTGYHRLGSGRVFFDVESNVSSSGTDGRLFVASDTSRLFHVGSGGTMLLGGQTALLHGNLISATSIPQTSFWAVESGVGNTGATASVVVGIPSGYSGLPIVTLQACDNTIQPAILHLTRTNGLQFTVTSYIVNGGATVTQSNLTFVWQSMGTRAL